MRTSFEDKYYIKHRVRQEIVGGRVVKLPSLREKKVKVVSNSDVFQASIKFSDEVFEDFVTKSAYERLLFQENPPENPDFYWHGGKIEGFSYYDSYHGRPRLNISVHGVFERSMSGLGSRVVMGENLLDSDFVVSLAEQYKEVRDFESIRLISCYSADGGRGSLISRVSQRMKMPVKGYKGRVLGTDLNILTGMGKAEGSEAGLSALKSIKSLGRVQTLRNIGGNSFSTETKAVIAGIEFWDHAT